MYLLQLLGLGLDLLGDIAPSGRQDAQPVLQIEIKIEYTV